MNPPYDFDEKLIEAAPWEKRIAEKIRDFMMKFNIRMIPYDNLEDIQRQKDGMDFTIKSEVAGWEVKTRAPEWYLDGILLETVSDVKRKKPGWLYTSKAHCIAYVWLNESKTNLQPIGYFIRIQELRKTRWCNEAPRRYYNSRHYTTSKRKTPYGMAYWRTDFIIPPINDFPKGTLYRFNAVLPSNVKQTILPAGEGSEKCEEG